MAQRIGIPRTKYATGVLCAAIFLVIAFPSTARAADCPPVISIYLPQDAADARRRAQEQCKPLVVHVVPNSRVGVEQAYEFYGRFGKISKEVLDKVVIVLLPRDRYAKFAAQLGINDAGGLRTISAYDLDTLDSKSVATCRAGFI